MNTNCQVSVAQAVRERGAGVRRVPRLAAALLALALGLMGAVPGAAGAADLPVLTVQADARVGWSTHEGVVQAVRSADLAAQVSGSVQELGVRAGDTVRAGQVLLRIDARAAEQVAAASGAQVAAAQAQLDVATRELARKRELAARKYISQGALEHAESQQRAAQAQVRALASQAGAARTQAAFHVLRAPFDGVVSAVEVERGDMVMPGRPLIRLYDPAAMRVSAHLPASRLQGTEPQVRAHLAGGDMPVVPARLQVLPTVDPRSLTREVRAELPAGTAAVPGQFARLTLQGADGATAAGARIFVPASAVVRRAEVTAVYVLGAQQRPLLRQVRLGPVRGDAVEVLAGLDAGESLITDVAAATRAVAGRP